MLITYDKKADAMYIKFKEGKIDDSDEDESGNIIIDYDANRTVIGIEILSVSSKISQPINPVFKEL